MGLMFWRRKILADEAELMELVERSKKGEAEAFGELYESMVGRIYRYIFYKVGEVEAAEDLTQEVFVRVYRKLRQFRGGSFWAWVYTVAKNLVTDYYRKQKPEVELEEWHDKTDGGEEKLEELELRRWLNKLPKKYREVVEWRYIMDESIAETAKMLKMSESGVKVTAHRAIKKLKEMMEE